MFSLNEIWHFCTFTKIVWNSCMHIYLCRFDCIFIRLWVYKIVITSAHMYMSISLCICASANGRSIYVWMSLYECVCICMCMHTHIHIFMCVCVWKCMCVWISACDILYVCISVYLCVSLFVHSVYSTQCVPSHLSSCIFEHLYTDISEFLCAFTFFVSSC